MLPPDATDVRKMFLWLAPKLTRALTTPARQIRAYTEAWAARRVRGEDYEMDDMFNDIIFMVARQILDRKWTREALETMANEVVSSIVNYRNNHPSLKHHSGPIPADLKTARALARRMMDSGNQLGYTRNCDSPMIITNPAEFEKPPDDVRRLPRWPVLRS